MRRELEEQLEALEREHDGDSLVAEVERLAGGLLAAERELLQELLVERSGAADYALDRRIREPRLPWLRDALRGQRRRAPDEPGRRSQDG